MMKILLYGGCHALILRDMLEEDYGDQLVCTLLVNFALIQSGRPFPYDDLKDYDVVFFSPIEHKGAYNTSHLVEFCRGRSIKAILFPWLEWHGYCPGATKGSFKGRFQWYYPELTKLAASFDEFEPFYHDVVEHFPDDATIDRTFERSTAMIADVEQRLNAPVRVSKFILDHYDESRLFLISDHPSESVYRHVLEQFLSLVGLEGVQTTRSTHRLEPQWRWRTPIFPRVSQRLGLLFDDSQWVDDELVPGRGWDLQTYLRLYFYSDSVILGPIQTATLFVTDDERPGSELTFDGATRLLAKPLGEDERNTCEEYTLLQALSGGPSLRANEQFRVRADQWRSTWQF